MLTINLNTNVDTICKKAHRKLTALLKIKNYMERGFLMNAFFKAQFNYCPIIWMFYSRRLNNKISRLHSLRIIYNDKHSNFEKLLSKDNSVFIHYNNMHALATEFYKLDASPKIMREVF